MHGDMDIQGFLEAKKGYNSCLEMNIFYQLRKELPPVFTREFASEKIGRIFSAKSMSNADALGIGPSVKVKIGKEWDMKEIRSFNGYEEKMKHDAPHVKKENNVYYMPNSTPFRTF